MITHTMTLPEVGDHLEAEIKRNDDTIVRKCEAIFKKMLRYKIRQKVFEYTTPNKTKLSVCVFHTVRRDFSYSVFAKFMHRRRNEEWVFLTSTSGVRRFTAPHFFEQYAKRLKLGNKTIEEMVLLLFKEHGQVLTVDNDHPRQPGVFPSFRPVEGGMVIGTFQQADKIQRDLTFYTPDMFKEHHKETNKDTTKFLKDIKEIPPQALDEYFKQEQGDILD